jgi:hypothetical protein
MYLTDKERQGESAMMEQSKTGAGSPMGVNDFLRTARNLGRLIDDPEALGQAMEVVEAFEREVAVAALRLKEEGYSFTDLARANGTKRQTAAERWGKAWKRFGLLPQK